MNLSPNDRLEMRQAVIPMAIWLMEECAELVAALQQTDNNAVLEEIGDVVATSALVASLMTVGFGDTVMASALGKWRSRQIKRGNVLDGTEVPQIAISIDPASLIALATKAKQRPYLEKLLTKLQDMGTALKQPVQKG
jgi:hypothetical protein